MAFSFGGGAAAGGVGGLTQGNDLEVIQTEVRGALLPFLVNVVLLLTVSLKGAWISLDRRRR
jgi:hypothetical protein